MDVSCQRRVVCSVCLSALTVQNVFAMGPQTIIQTYARIHCEYVYFVLVVILVAFDGGLIFLLLLLPCSKVGQVC